LLPLRIPGSTHEIIQPEFKDSPNRAPNFHVKMHNNIFYTAWEPTPSELDILVNGGKIILACVGMQPYVIMKAFETDLRYSDYITPYPIKENYNEEDWPAMTEAKTEKRKRGRPKKVV